jgi:hypothetical protein
MSHLNDNTRFRLVEWAGLSRVVITQTTWRN